MKFFAKYFLVLALSFTIPFLSGMENPGDPMPSGSTPYNYNAQVALMAALNAGEKNKIADRATKNECSSCETAGNRNYLIPKNNFLFCKECRAEYDEEEGKIILRQESVNHNGASSPGAGSDSKAPFRFENGNKASGQLRVHGEDKGEITPAKQAPSAPPLMLQRDSGKDPIASGSHAQAPPHTTAQQEATKECGICMDDKVEKQFVELHCGHAVYCGGCLYRMLKDALNDKNIRTLKCPEPDCAQVFSIDDIRSICDSATDNLLASTSQADINELERIRELVTTYCKIASLKQLTKNQHARQCPTPDCKAVFINDQGIKQIITCKGCEKKYCSNCLIDHSSCITCEQAKADQASAEGDTGAWMAKNSKKCPKCPVRIEKNGGCNHITCGSCKHEFCWKCLEPRIVSDGNHKCPLFDSSNWTDDQLTPKTRILLDQMRELEQTLNSMDQIEEKRALREQISQLNNEIARSATPNNPALAPIDSILRGLISTTNLFGSPELNNLPGLLELAPRAANRQEAQAGFDIAQLNMELNGSNALKAFFDCLDKPDDRSDDR